MYTFHKYWTAPTEEVIQPYLEFRNRYSVPIWLGESGENTDAWIHDFVQVLEKDEIGWTFWPYKKMDSGSSFVAWQKPAYWDEIVAYGKMPGNTGDAEKRIAARPSLEHARAAFQSLLEKCPSRSLSDEYGLHSGFEFDRCHPTSRTEKIPDRNFRPVAVIPIVFWRRCE